MNYLHVRLTSLTFIISMLMLSSAHAQAALKSPWDIYPPKNDYLSSQVYSCPKPVAISKDLSINGFYKRNGFGDTPDRAKMKELHAKTASISTSLKQLIHTSDMYRLTGGYKYADCTAFWLSSLADSQSLSGRMVGSQSYYQQSWALTTYSIAWLKIRNSDAIKPSDKEKIVSWLKGIALSNKVYWDKKNRKQKGGNIVYSAGLGIAATGIAADDIALYNWGVDVFDIALKYLTEDGYLLQETKRGTHALSYEVTDAAMLVTLAGLSSANDQNLYSHSDGKFNKFIETVIATLEEPSKLDVIAKKKQPHINSRYAGWLRTYLSLYPSERGRKVLRNNSHKNADFYKLGGNPPPQVNK